MGLNWNYTHPREVYPEMASMMPSLDNISWERVEREDAVTYPCRRAGPAGPRRGVRQGLPAPGRLRQARRRQAHAAGRDARRATIPFILTTGRQLEHWHTGAMTRRATVLDALEPSAIASVSLGTIAEARHPAGRHDPRVTRRGPSSCASRQDDAVPDGVVFIPFAYVEAAANLLTNPALDPFGKIPEFKYCAAKVEPAGERLEAAE